MGGRRSVANPTREHLQLAIEQNRGALDVFGKDLERQVAAAKLTSAERETFGRQLGAARAAIEDYVDWLTALDTRLAMTWPDYDKQLTAAGVPHEGHIYENAVHGFNNDATPERYNKTAADFAFNRTIEWFNKYVRTANT